MPQSFCPAHSGIGLRAPHFAALQAQRPALGFLEIHAENYFGGGPHRRKLQALAEHYPLSVHGVGLSLGRADGLDLEHLRHLAEVVATFAPVLVSEHLSFCGVGGAFVPDLLPLPMTEAALEIFSQHIDHTQTLLGRQILIENPSAYLAYDQADYDEPGFLTALVRRTGCGLLLDINNIVVSAQNLGFDPLDYLHAIPADAVQQYHLAGYQITPLPSGAVLYLDTHGAPVHPPVWALYRAALRQIGDRPTLIEWDSAIPSLEQLCAEAAHADRLRAQEVRHVHAA